MVLAKVKRETKDFQGGGDANFLKCRFFFQKAALGRPATMNFKFFLDDIYGSRCKSELQASLRSLCPLQSTFTSHKNVYFSLILNLVLYNLVYTELV